jgi:transcriptional regulator with XRE-family HTH domain
MPTPRLENYLRAYRRKSALSQRDVAFLLGCQNGAQVSRYEKRRRLPPLRTALACEAAFGVPVSELFAGLRERVGKEIEKRLLELGLRLQTKTSKGSEARMIAQKLRWVAERRGTTTENSPTAS